uniref:Phospholipid phosphatase 1 n=1 Tax=Peromyscus maniculatus bairdii TaxID=230844 RepID=A0A8C8T1V2_PERMB
ATVLIIFNDIFIYSLLLAGLPFAILTSRHTPFQRGVFCNDESIKYPYREDTIPYALLGGIIIPFSIIVMIAGESLSVHFNSLQSNSFVGNHYIASIYKAIGAFLFGAAASQSLTDIAKYSIGRLRPHFLAVCDLDWSKINCSDGYIENYICRGNADKVREGRLSFYSGHSSFSMYCMLFTAVSLGGGDVCGGGAGGGAPHAGGFTTSSHYWVIFGCNIQKIHKAFLLRLSRIRAFFEGSHSSLSVAVPRGVTHFRVVNSKQRSNSLCLSC